MAFFTNSETMSLSLELFSDLIIGSVFGNYMLPSIIIIIKNVHDYSDTVAKTLQGHFT